MYRNQRPVFRAVVVMILVSCVSGRGWAQLMGSLQPVLHFRTDFFDIYAPSDLASQALRLSGFADQTYAMLCEFFGAKASERRIPVFLSDTQYALNGYTTLYPSNRIVIFLASADPRSQLATMQDELSSVFLHELVHYVTLNERTASWQAMACLWGDWVAPELWMMPQALVEGTAVWIESGLGGKGLSSGVGLNLGSGGRLNDPAALESVRLERAEGQERSLWDVSGLADFYGAGSLPYLYGGLFVDFLSKRYGPEFIVRLWHASAGGNIFWGFDGTLTSRGVVERETGVAPRQLWEEFLAWVTDNSGAGQGALSDASSGANGVTEIFSGYVGTLGYGEGVLYFVDLEQRGLYALPLDGATGRTAVKNNKKPVKPERLLAVDGSLRNIFCNVRFGVLDLDWIRTDAQNRQIPARYRYDLKSRSLTYECDLPVPEPGNALLGLQDRPVEDVFLYDAWEDPETSVRYGLARIGTAVLPARRLPGGNIEVVGIPDSSIRWLSPGFRGHADSADSVRFALSTIPDNGLSRLAILEEKESMWQLSMAKSVAPGGVHQPIFVDASHVVYRKANKDGRTTLCLLDISDQLTAPSQVAWLSPSEWMTLYGPKSPTARDEGQTASVEDTQNTTLRLSPTLFPVLFSTSRIPYLYDSVVGLEAIACDLTERLAWEAFGGWDFSIQRPILRADVRLAAGAWQFDVHVADQGVPTSPVARKSTVGAMFRWTRTLLPSFRSFSANLHAAFAGIQNSYALGDFFDLVPNYYAWATGLGLDFSSAYASRYPPYDMIGVFLSGTVEYESASGVGFGGASVSASASLRGRLSASVYGAVALDGRLAFTPSARYLASNGSYAVSAADIPYPEYKEYRNFLNPSAWYVFGETQYRLWSLEAGWVAPLPFLPSLALRRIIGSLGLRGAGLDIGGRASLLSSIFAKVDFDCALLAGLAAETHTHFTVELAWAFQASTAKVPPLHIAVGLQTSL